MQSGGCQCVGKLGGDGGGGGDVSRCVKWGCQRVGEVYVCVCVCVGGGQWVCDGLTCMRSGRTAAAEGPTFHGHTRSHF